MTVRHLAAEVAFADDGVLGEGPVWDPATTTLLWADVPRRRLMRGDPSSGSVAEQALPNAIASFGLRADGTLVAARKGEIVTWGLDGDFTVLARVPGEVGRFNDGKCDRQGRWWVGSISNPVEKRTGALYRVSPDKSVARLLDGVGISNGLGWTADDRTFFYVDSLSQGIDAFAFDAGSGELSRRRRVVDIPMPAGLPDGLAVDAEGCVWVAMFFGQSVHRYTPDGVLDAVVDLPVTAVASVAFGGPALGTLYITTGVAPLGPMAERHGVVSRGVEPLAGSVFACTPGVDGVEVGRFAG